MIKKIATLASLSPVLLISSCGGAAQRNARDEFANFVHIQEHESQLAYGETLKKIFFNEFDGEPFTNDEIQELCANNYTAHYVGSRETDMKLNAGGVSSYATIGTSTNMDCTTRLQYSNNTARIKDLLTRDLVNVGYEPSDLFDIYNISYQSNSWSSVNPISTDEEKFTYSFEVYVTVNETSATDFIRSACGKVHSSNDICKSIANQTVAMLTRQTPLTWKYSNEIVMKKVNDKWKIKSEQGDLRIAQSVS